MARINLRGDAVLVTRPKHQNQNLAELIEQAGGRAILQPSIEIVACQLCSHSLLLLNKLEQFDVIIFVSRNAVDFGLSLIRSAPSKLSPRLKIGAIGKPSSDALHEYGYTVDWCPSNRFNSEAFLELKPTYHVDKMNILIIRGKGGRELLAERLKSRGAFVEYLEVYRREIPDIPGHRYAEVFSHQRPSIITTSSLIGLKHLLKMTPNDYLPQLLGLPLIVVNDSMLKFARQQGFKNRVLLAKNATDQSIMGAIFEYFSGRSD